MNDRLRQVDDFAFARDVAVRAASKPRPRSPAVCAISASDNQCVDIVLSSSIARRRIGSAVSPDRCRSFREYVPNLEYAKAQSGRNSTARLKPSMLPAFDW